jgi:hypothetical protein
LRAALTYARRHALFTLVGIAEEGDIDASDLNAPTPPARTVDERRRREHLRAALARGKAAILWDDEDALLRLRPSNGGAEPTLVRGERRSCRRGRPAPRPASNPPMDGRTLDGRVEATGAVFEAKFMLPWSFSEEAAAEKHMAQLQHNMCVVASRASVITGGGKWVEIAPHADPLYQHLILTAERKSWRCVESSEPPRLFGVEPPNRASRRSVLSYMAGRNSPASLPGPGRPTSSTKRPRQSSRA